MTTLQESFPYIDWRDFIKWNLKNSIPVYENEIITVPDVAYLRQLDIILETTPKRTIANYIGMRLVSFASDILNDVLHHRLDQYNKEAFGVLKPDSRLTACIKKTKELYVLLHLTEFQKIINEIIIKFSVYQYQRQQFTYASFSTKNQKMRPLQWQRIFTNFSSTI